MQGRIRKLRRELDLTQQEFADRIGIKRNTIANYETGRNEPIDAVISLICREFNVSERWLRTGQGDMFNKLTREQEIATFIGGLLADDADDIKKRFIAMLSGLSENGWAAIAEMAEKMKKD